MALLHDDLFSNDIVDDPEDLDLLVEGRVEEENDTGGIEQQTGDNSDKDEKTDQKTDDKTEKKKRKQSQRPRLNILRLMDTNVGLMAAERMFKDVKFKGKGHELDDLNLIMKKMEIWAHKLYPSFDFDDCLAKLEKLGNTKSVATYVKKLRMGLEDEIVAPQHDDDDDNNNDENTEVVNVGQKEDSPKAKSPDRFDQLIRNPPQNVPVHGGLTEEQRERMRKNRLIAEQRRLARLKAMQEKQANNVAIEPEKSVPNELACGTGSDELTSVNSQITHGNNPSERPNSFESESINIDSTLNSQVNGNNSFELPNTFQSESQNIDSTNNSQIEKDVSSNIDVDVESEAQNKYGSRDACSESEQTKHDFHSTNNARPTFSTDLPVPSENSYDIFALNEDIEMEELP